MYWAVCIIVCVCLKRERDRVRAGRIQYFCVIQRQHRDNNVGASIAQAHDVR